MSHSINVNVWNRNVWCPASKEIQISAANSRKGMLSLSGILKDQSLSIIRNGL
jgi:hypothetical protein